MNNEIKRTIIEEGQFTETHYPYTIKPDFSKLGSIIEFSRQEPLISFTSDDSIQDLLGFNGSTCFEEYNLLPNPVDVLSFDNFFIETDTAEGNIFEGNRTGILHNFTMDVDPGYENIKKCRGGIQLYSMESKDFSSKISFYLKNGNGDIVSSKSQSKFSSLPIKEIYVF